MKLTKDQLELLLSIAKECTRCKEFKLITEFRDHSIGPSGKHSWCNPCINEANISYRKIRKLKIIENYGGECICCGEKNWEFLTIDHVDNDGAKHKKELGGASYLYHFLKKNNYPRDKYRLLCFNCNSSRGSFGYCPHEKKVELKIVS